MSNGGINFSFDFNGNENKEKSTEQINIAVLADFGQELFHSPREVTRAELDDIFAELCPRLELEVQGQVIELNFEELEDLHPDEIYRKCSLFVQLRELKKRLMNPDTFAAAAAELGISTAIPEPVPQEGGESSLLEGLLGGSVDRPDGEKNLAKASPRKAESFISAIVSPYVEAVAHPKLDTCLQFIEMAMSGTMKEILHHPKFQKLESLWKSLEFLLQRIEDETKVQVYLIQGHKQDLVEGRLDAVLLDSHPSQWNTIIADFVLDDSEQDLAFLKYANALAAKIGANFSSALKISIDDLEPSSFFDELKQLKNIQLFAPRFLLRYVYGKKTDEIEAFSFEEWDNNFEHNHYLWANGAFAAAAIAIDSFQNGRKINRLGELPVHVFNGATTPCAEFWLSERQLQKLQSLGLSPLLPLRGTDSIEIY